VSRGRSTKKKNPASARVIWLRLVILAPQDANFRADRNLGCFHCAGIVGAAGIRFPIGIDMSLVSPEKVEQFRAPSGFVFAILRSLMSLTLR
jgi:hypothetical protein